MITGKGITKTFQQRGNVLDGQSVQALRGVDFSVPRGGAASFIGESGCGKTTLGRIIAGLETYDAGEIVIDGVSMDGLSRRKQQPYFRRVQLIHQDPYSALNPTRTIFQTLQAPLKLRAKQTGRPRSWIGERAEELLGLVDLDPAYVLQRYPHQLSGGMRQRVVVARALTMDPEMLIADEAVSMIDVSLRLGILALLRDLRERLDVSLLYITHDIATARYIGDDGEMYVIYRGTVVERGPTDTVISEPAHPYTQSLISAIPVLHGMEIPGPESVEPLGALDTVMPAGVPGAAEKESAGVPGAADSSSGCLFAGRCPFHTERCFISRPVLGEAGDALQDPNGRQHACFYPQTRHVAALPSSGATK